MRKGWRNAQKRQALVTYRPEELERRMLLSTAIAAFAPQVTFGAGASPRSVATADVNGDGKLDLIVANAGGNSLSVMLGNGNGTFGGQSIFAVGSSPYSVAVADVNRDGRIDLIASNNGGNGISVLLGNGNGTFLGQQTFGAGNQARFVASADVNGDGKPDVVVANYGAGTGSILLGNGNGTFGGQTTFAAGAQAASISVGDFNRDGKLDLAIANKSANTVSVLLGNGNGSFGTRATFGAGNLPFSVASGDVNGDGKLDLVVAEESSNSVGVLLGNGNGTFGNQTTFGVGTVPVAVVLSDVNGDGKLDIASVNYNSNSVSVLLGSGNGSFAGQRTFGTGTAPFAIGSADVNRDGRADLLVANGASGGAGVLLGDVQPYVISINRSNPAGPSTSASSVNYGVTFSAPVIGVDPTDFALALSGITATTPVVVSGSGAAYTVTVNGISGSGTLGLNLVDDGSIKDGAGNPLQGGSAASFQAQQTFASGSEPYSIATADLDGDGRADLVVANSRGGNFVNVMLGNGNGTFKAQKSYAAGTSPDFVTTADVNRDGKLDLIVGAGSAVSVLMGNGDGSFGVPQTFAAGGAVAIAVVDLNGDGLADLAVATGSGAVSVLLGNGNGTFGAQMTFAAGTFPSAIVAGDFNRDGKMDLAVANGIDHDASVLLGNGNGTFQPQLTFAAGSNDISIAAGDIDGDGKTDLVVGNNYFAGQGNVSVLLGNGNGTFGAQQTIAAGAGPTSVALTDLNNDGKLDIAVSNSGNSEGVGSSASVLLGNGNGTFAAQQTFGTGAEPYSIAAGDLNADGQVDLVTANLNGSNVSVLLGNAPPAGFAGESYTVVPPGPTTYVVQKLGLMGTNQSGANPQATLTRDSVGNLYGTTRAGGAYGDGTIFMIASGTSIITALASFDGLNGAYPYAGVAVDAAGNIFGSTTAGGDNNGGTIFELAHNSSKLTVLQSLAANENNPNGNIVQGGMTVDGNGDIYGTTYGLTIGSVFKIDHTTLAVTTVAPIPTSVGGPSGALLVDAQGNIFGTTQSTSYSTIYGTIFEIIKGDAAVTTLATFSGSNGQAPVGGLVRDVAGNLFGATNTGGASGHGAVFELPVGSNTISLLASFTGANGGNPTGTMAIDSAGNLFGTTSGDNYPGGVAYLNGSVFEVAHASTSITTLAVLNGTNGSKPYSGLVMDGVGNLYGTASRGGAAGQGVVFKLAAGAAAVTDVASFDPVGAMDGGMMLVDGAGNVFGLAVSGGPTNDGAVIEIPHGSSTPITLASFNGTNGSGPTSLLVDGSGNLFGTTNLGGASGYGAIFEIAANTSNIVPLASFNITNGAYGVDLIIDGSGNLYGVTDRGGTSGWGTLFELAKGSSTITVLASFDQAHASPGRGLVRDAAGNFFGTSRGTTASSDTVFKVAPGSSTVTTLITMGYNYFAKELTADLSGNMYGVAFGTSGPTGIFKIPKGGSSLQFLAYGVNPDGRLLLDGSGNIFATEELGGPGYGGAVIELPQGTSSINELATFNGLVGQHPFSGVAIDSAGNLYGMGTGGSGRVYNDLLGYGAPGGGTIFRLTKVPVVDSVAGTSGPDGIILMSDPDSRHVHWTMGAASGVLATDDPNGLTLVGNGGQDTITLDYTNGNPLPNILHLNGSFRVNGLSGALPLFVRTIEIGQSTVYFDTTANPGLATAIQLALTRGYNGGLWNGDPGGDGSIMSSAAAGGPANTFGVGYADSADGIVAGQPANTVEVRYTVMGDTNLDRVVNAVDAVQMARHYLIAGQTAWDLGNFNYDSAINLLDATILQKNYNATATGSVVAATAEAVSAGAGAAASGVLAEPPLSTSTVAGGGGNLDPVGTSGTTPDALNQNHKSKQHGKELKRGR